ncbi:flavin reductase family protein [Falsiroseomonas oryziterrae]|uniref:flavin reductase family protein n=1 Tax=Falsiroseomonas oryziterrae TaxID=2911368 RepID=UPI001F472EEA|nr:flavin reductase family protein [Roseomonas sp. NPKOSM-4]
MFYEAGTHRAAGLPHDPLKAIVAPRPIGWISTLDGQGRANLAPYSFFNMIQTTPAICCFGSDGWKHTAANAIASGEFVVNLATRPLFEAMNASSAALSDGESEFEHAGLERAACRLVKPPRVAASPASLECRVVHAMELKDVDGRATGGHLVIGQVVGVHIADWALKEGRFDMLAARTIARCGYRDYTEVTELFSALRPTDGGSYAPGQRDL